MNEEDNTDLSSIMEQEIGKLNNCKADFFE